jgi:hypothetical protein
VAAAVAITDLHFLLALSEILSPPSASKPVLQLLCFDGN